MNTRSTVLLAALSLLVTAVYLGVSAPPPLPEETATPGTDARIPVDTVFRILAHENDVARTLYTQRIVGPGLTVGLAFSEDWQRDGVTAGPLPALFLRRSAERLVRSGSPIGLFLGSDKPISPSNLFEGEQARRFETIRETREPEFFLDPDTQMYTAMFPDIAGARPCVACHNEHPDTPRTDWALGDVMGATTWILPRESYTTDEVLELVTALRGSFGGTYREYLDEYERAEATTGGGPLPTVGTGWPGDPAKDGPISLPDVETFVTACEEAASRETLRHLLAATPGD